MATATMTVKTITRTEATMIPVVRDVLAVLVPAGFGLSSSGVIVVVVVAVVVGGGVVVAR